MPVVCSIQALTRQLPVFRNQFVSSCSAFRRSRQDPIESFTKCGPNRRRTYSSASKVLVRHVSLTRRSIVSWLCQPLLYFIRYYVTGERNMKEHQATDRTSLYAGCGQHGSIKLIRKGISPRLANMLTCLCGPGRTRKQAHRQARQASKQASNVQALITRPP